MSDTPKTDDAAFTAFVDKELSSATVVTVGFARELERELTAVAAKRDEAQRWVCELWEKYQPATSSMTARDYAAECGWDCFEKKADPLAEMWAALESYQPMADRDGHGESWRIMCEERTEDAAEIAQDNARVASISSGLTEPWVAAMCARWAVAWREHSEQNTQQAIASIRRAKEVQNG